MPAKKELATDKPNVEFKVAVARYILLQNIKSFEQDDDIDLDQYQADCEQAQEALDYTPYGDFSL